MKPALLDTNVLIALAWPNHIHHELALAWLRANQKYGWATCPVTESGFVRVSSNRLVISEARSPREALDLLRQIRALPHHRFWADDISLVDSKFFAARKLVGYRQVTDAHLVALALRHGGRLTTLDKGVLQLVPDEFVSRDVVCLLVDP